MSFDNKELCRIFSNHRIECKHEENLRLFIYIFKISPVETVELMFNFDKKKLGKNLQSTLIYQRTFEELYFIR